MVFGALGAEGAPRQLYEGSIGQSGNRSKVPAWLVFPL
jgi:hypothetical protein